jgi:hypothetical protein
MMREELMQRIQTEGIDPKGTGQLIDAAQYGNVLATLWQQTSLNGGATSYTVRLEHANLFKPDGLGFEGTDYEDTAGGLLWARDHLQAFFFLSGHTSWKEGSEEQ